MIAVGNYVIVSPSELGNYKIADTQNPDPRPLNNISLQEITIIC